ncbi:MAG TPA: aldo/keto reductase, partial [Thermoanaerobaculia bacterium]|nr:aldo/keto reductase [Thermoanaerobaculia bacterium]
MAIDRRTLLASIGAAGAASLLKPFPAAAERGPILTRAIPSSGERLPLVGLGSSITFNVGDDVAARNSCAEVMRAFFRDGGRLIDTSPMYGSSQEVIGYGLGKLGRPKQVFSADKVWIPAGARGPAQIEESRSLWGMPKLDLLQ